MAKKIKSTEWIIYVISFSIFIIATILGWLRLQYGFNFLDEGWQMTEAWRITAGDDFLKDKFTGTLRNSTLINALVFKFYPEISLLEFRMLYFILTLLSLLLFSISLYKATHNEIPFYLMIFSIFAFTGLDVTGIASYLNYYTYPHLFLTIHLSFLILGITHESVFLRKIFFFLSGIFLWLIGFSLLHLSISLVSIIFLFVFIQWIRTDYNHFSLKDALLVLLPCFLLWSAIVIFYGKDFIANVLSSLHLAFSVPTYNIGLLFSVNWEYSKLIIVSTLFLMVFLLSTRLINTIAFLCAPIAISAVMLLILKTNIFGLYEGGTNGALWFSCLLFSSSFLFLLHFLVKVFRKESFSKSEAVSLLLLISSVMVTMNGIFFSSLGILVTVFSSIPMTTAMCYSMLSVKALQNRSWIIRWLTVVIFLMPFYYTMAEDRWKFNFYDVSPQQATAEIKEGFCKGIKTNPIYKNLYEWIRRTANLYSGKNDYIISYVSSPMVHMIAERRPATDDSYIAFDVLPQDYFYKSLEFMKMRGRRPRLIYVFEAMPVLLASNPEGSYRTVWMEKQFTFPSSDPFSHYVVENMTLIESFTISAELSIYARCFIDHAYISEMLKN